MQLSFDAPRGEVHLHRGPWQTMWLPPRFVLIGDPPYGIDYESNYHLGHGRAESAVGSRSNATTCAGDHDTVERDSFLEQVGGWEAAAVFGPDVNKLRAVPPWMCPTCKVETGDCDACGGRGKYPFLLILDKGEGSGMGDLSWPWKPNTETIAIYGRGWHGKRTSTVLRHRVLAFSRETVSNGRRDEFEKDLATVLELVSKAPEGLPVVDPWAGSGTTAEACALLGRQCFTAEIVPKKWPVIVGRLGEIGVVPLEARAA
jgi:hypothetical protein